MLGSETSLDLLCVVGDPLVGVRLEVAEQVGIAAVARDHRRVMRLQEGHDPRDIRAAGELASDAPDGRGSSRGPDATRTHHRDHPWVDLVVRERTEPIANLHALRGGIVNAVGTQPARDGESEDPSHDCPEHGKAQDGAGMCVEPAGQRLHRFNLDPSFRG